MRTGIYCWIMPNWYRFKLLLIALVLSQESAGDALGATDAVEIAKLTEIITQMTELLEKTQSYLDVQQRLTDMQERSFFRKAESYGKEIRKLVRQQKTLEARADELKEDPLHIRDMTTDLRLIKKQAALINERDTKENLLELAALLELVASKQWLVGTAKQTLEEMASDQNSNTQDQLLAGIFFAISQLLETVEFDAAALKIREQGAKWSMQGSYSVFNGEDYER